LRDKPALARIWRLRADFRCGFCLTCRPA